MRWVLKVVKGQVDKEFSVEEPKDGCCYEGNEDWLKEAVGAFQDFLHNSMGLMKERRGDKWGLHMQYCDKEMDWISVTSEKDMKEALRYMQLEQLGELKFYIKDSPEVTVTPVQKHFQSSVENSKVIMRGITLAAQTDEENHEHKFYVLDTCAIIRNVLSNIPSKDDQMVKIQDQLLVWLADKQLHDRLIELLKNEKSSMCVTRVMEEACASSSFDDLINIALSSNNETIGMLFKLAISTSAGCELLHLLAIHHAKNYPKSSCFSGEASGINSNNFDSKAHCVHPKSSCDGCDAFPITGVRYKSLSVNDFDLCEKCETTGRWQSHEPFVKLTTAELSSKFSSASHDGNVCDGCKCCPIKGPRFASIIQENFDLCEACEFSGKWSLSHCPFIKHVSATKLGSHEVESDDMNNHSSRCKERLISRRRCDGRLDCHVVDNRTEGVCDGDDVVVGSTFTKSWSLTNSGPVQWPKNCFLSCVGGQNMQLSEKPITLPPLAPGHSCTLKVSMVAPAKAGLYTGYWRVCTKNENEKECRHFGPRFWAEILAVEEETQSAVNNSSTSILPSAKMELSVILPSEEIAGDVPLLINGVGPEKKCSPPSRVVAEEDPSSSSRQVNEVVFVLPLLDRSDVSQSSALGTYEVAVPTEYQEILQALQEMGFGDVERNVALLRAHPGQLDDVLDALLRTTTV